ncbi:hypothetical protein ACE10W_16725 [Bradyrhizobium sp. B025]|jgi:hypothetical protein|uniref:hypothetical protein n=1 Tax=Bradyrhizobium sp. B025 TaxID=3344829 RepID=UPI0035D4F070
MLMSLFNEALDEFLWRERDNIIANISERNLCGRLMLYLDAARLRYGLADYFTDTEYNRNKGDLKRVIHGPDDFNTITCDLIMHSRGRRQDDNLIAIEMKKRHHKAASKDADRRRLIALTRAPAAVQGFADMPDHVYDYQLGLFIELDGDQATCLVEVYQQGAKVEDFQRGF